MSNAIPTSPAEITVPFPQNRSQVLERAGVIVLRFGLVFLLVLLGGFKFTAFEASGIQPLVSHSPFLSWLYWVFSVQGASNVIGIIEITTGLLMASRRWLPLVSGFASLFATSIFLITLSFLFTTPGITEPTNPAGGFLLKDILLLGAALLTAGEAFRAATRH